MKDHVVMNEPDHKRTQVLEAVSVFIQPLELDAPGSLGRYAWVVDVDDGFDEDDIRIASLKEWKPTDVEFGAKNLQVSLTPKIGWIKDCEWVALIIEARVRLEGRDIEIDDLLSFNVGFRKSQGIPVPDNSHFEMDLGNYLLSDGRPCSEIYKGYADEILGENRYRPLRNLQKAVLLSFGRFKETLSDEDLYRFGSVAFPHEQVSGEWIETVKENIVDRWKSAGWRCFAYPYSMVYSLNESYSGRLDDKIRESFLDRYVKTGVTIALHRAMLQGLPLKIKQAENLNQLRQCHKEMSRINKYVGARWTSEGTHNTKIEQSWRKATGIEDRTNEVKELLDQKIDVYEAQETDRLNGNIILLQLIFGSFYGAQISLALGSNIPHLVYGMLSGLIFILFVMWAWNKYFVSRKKNMGTSR